MKPKNALAGLLISLFLILEVAFATPTGQSPLPPDGAQAPDATKPRETRMQAISAANRFTGLVIDAVGLPAETPLAPVIYDAWGTLVYDNASASPDTIRWTRALSLGMQDKRVGAHPLVVQAIQLVNTTGGLESVVVVSKADANKILDADAQTHFLQRAAVIFVADPESAVGKGSPIGNHMESTRTEDSGPRPGDTMIENPSIDPDMEEPSVVKKPNPPKPVAESTPPPVTPFLKKEVQPQSPENIWNINSEKWQEISHDLRLLGALNSAPVELSRAYRLLTSSDKAKIYKEIHGTTSTPIGDVDNRAAFISGAVLGHDVFDILGRQLEDQVHSKAISMEEYLRNYKLLQYVSEMTPQQRKLFVDLLEAELRN